MSCTKVREHTCTTHTHTPQSSRNLWALYTEHKTGDLQQCKGLCSTEDLFLCGKGNHNYTCQHILYLHTDSGQASDSDLHCISFGVCISADWSVYACVQTCHVTWHPWRTTGVPRPFPLLVWWVLILHFLDLNFSPSKESAHISLSVKYVLYHHCLAPICAKHLFNSSFICVIIPHMFAGQREFTKCHPQMCYIVYSLEAMSSWQLRL